MGRERTLALTALLAALALGCGPSELSCEIDQTFSASRAESIRLAAKAWTVLCQQEVFFTSNGDWLVVSAAVPGGWRGSVDPDRHIFRIDPALTPDDLVFAVALHEFGHLLGLRHLPHGVHGVMAGPDDSDIHLEFSDADVIQARRSGC